MRVLHIRILESLDSLVRLADSTNDLPTWLENPGASPITVNIESPHPTNPELPNFP